MLEKCGIGKKKVFFLCGAIYGMPGSRLKGRRTLRVIWFIEHTAATHNVKLAGWRERDCKIVSSVKTRNCIAGMLLLLLLYTGSAFYHSADSSTSLSNN
jgi:hypothetical protein